ncbi:MAG: hypothetical protein A3H29_04295 [Acidobacteria bacterium RIFCSPLOWO2_02_FULL_67_21]|nr:MAG: hypothetical protein A3H29_04295 [Acidobacteria bacterium RIFCSPLOWO2_02_FULL_67_21]
MTVEAQIGLAKYVGLSVIQYERPSDRFVYAALARVRPLEDGAFWLRQIALLVPVALVCSAGFAFLKRTNRAGTERRDACRMALSGGFLIVVASALYREPTYVVAGAPLTAALAARYLVAPSGLSRGIAAGVLLFAAVAAVVWTKDSPLFRVSETPQAVSEAFGRLVASPPVPAESSGAPSPVLQYLRDCTADGDRLLVMGSTPFQVNYYARRPIAGGHVFWHRRWRSAPAYEAQSLELLRRQSVPFAFSTSSPVLDDFRAYPRIREYLVEHYAELEGTAGRLLIDMRRRPTGTFEPLGYPCFRRAPGGSTS